MRVGDLKKALASYPDELEVWATPCFIPFDEGDHFAVQAVRTIGIRQGHPDYDGGCFAYTEQNGRKVLSLGCT